VLESVSYKRRVLSVLESVVCYSGGLGNLKSNNENQSRLATMLSPGANNRAKSNAKIAMSKSKNGMFVYRCLRNGGPALNAKAATRYIKFPLMNKTVFS
jgi:hypothetical protein